MKGAWASLFGNKSSQPGSGKAATNVASGNVFAATPQEKRYIEHADLFQVRKDQMGKPGLSGGISVRS